MSEIHDKDPAPAVTRSLRILHLLECAHGAPLSLAELARGLDAAKSSTSNICGVLEDGGMIRRVEGGYRLGRRTAELGGAFTDQFNQMREFYGVVERDPILCSEVVQVSMLDGLSALYLARYEGRFQRVGTPLGSRLPAVATGTGLAMLSRVDDAEIDRIIAATLDGVAAKAGGREGCAPLDAETIRSQIQECRDLGYAIDRGAGYAGLWGIAVPIEAWRPSDPPLGLGVALPAEESTEERVAEIGLAALAAARALTNPFSTRSRSS